MEYITKNHSKYLLMVHLIFVCKYRKLLLSQFGGQIKALFYEIAEEKDFGIIEMKVDKNHIHLLIAYSPKQPVLEIVRSLKQISTYRLWRQCNNHIVLNKLGRPISA